MTYDYAKMYDELQDARDKVFNLLMEGTVTGEIEQKLWDALKGIKFAQDAIRTEAGQ